MLRYILVTTLAMGSALAQVSVPKGAVEIEPGVYKHTNAAGKTVIFRKTPFGIVKSTEGAAKADTAAPAAGNSGSAASAASPFGEVKQNTTAQDVKVVERGEVLEFERPSPFGSYKWKSNKNDLTAEEREVWAKAKGKQAPAKTTGTKE